MPLQPMTMDDYEEMMQCSQIPGRGWLGACYAVHNHLDKTEKEEEEQKAKDKDKELDKGQVDGDSRDRSRSPKQKAGDPKLASKPQ